MEGTLPGLEEREEVDAAHVVAIDVDTRFHGEAGPNVEVRQLDVTQHPLGDKEFDLVHARALLQHLHQRGQVLDKMIAALKPGGWIVVQDSDWTTYEQQEIPEPFRTLSLGSLENSRRQTGWDGYCGRWFFLFRLGRRLSEARELFPDGCDQIGKSLAATV